MKPDTRKRLNEIRREVAKPQPCAAMVKDHFDVYERPCGNKAIAGAKYCRVHGGKS